MTDLPAIQAEIARELAYRDRTYPDRVRNGRMTAEEAEYQRAVMRAIAADMARITAIAPGAPLAAASHGFTWKARVDALDRELAMRARLYPGWTDKGLMTAAQAKTQNEALEACRHLYWAEGFDWTASNGSPCHWGKLGMGDTVEAARNEFRAHMAAVALEQQPAEQRQPALAL